MAERVLPPWDTIPYFASPKERLVLVNGNHVQLCEANPQRVVLILAMPSGAAGSAGVSTLPDSTTVNGITLNNQTPPLTITHATHGPLVQAAWFGSSGFGLSITVIEVFLNKWPGVNREDMYDRQNPARPAQRPRRNNR